MVVPVLMRLTKRERINLRRRLAERRKYDLTYFEKHYWAEDLPGHAGNMGLSYNDPLHLARFNVLARALVDTFDFYTILDAGCGIGLMLRNLASLGKIPTGIDVSPHAARIYRKTAMPADPPFLLSGLEALPFRENTFDLTFCSDVLEHVPLFDVEESITELIRVTNRHLVLTINLNNPYYFHPTILSRESWDTLFCRSGVLLKEKHGHKMFQERLSRKYPEYEAFVFRKSS